MPTFVNAKRIMALKLESTSGTAIAVADADFDNRLFDIQVDAEIEYWMNEFASGRHSMAGGVMGKKKVSIQCKAAMNLAAAADTAPKLGKLFKVCGALETINTSTSVVYTPSAVKDEGNSITATIKIVFVATSGNALILTAKGCMGNCVISMDDLGKPLVAAFTFVGAFVSIADGTALVLTSPDTSIPPAIIGSAVTAAAAAQQIGKFSLDFGNEVQLDYDPSDTTGYLAAYISKRRPKMMMDPKTKLVASDAHYTRWAAGTESVISVATAVVGGFKWTVGAPKAQLKANKFADRNDEIVYDQEFELHESSGNDEWTLTQSA